MKKIFNYVCIASGMIAMLASCQKEEVTVPESGTVNMVITASQDNNTKTTLGSDGKLTWNATGEKLKVCQAYDNAGSPKYDFAESSEGTTTDGGKTMNFNVSFSSVEASSFDYFAIYPSSAPAKNSNKDPEKYKVNLAAVQTPTATSFDGSNDILVAQAKTGLTSQPSNLSFAFKRMTSVGKMTITNLNSTEKIRKIIFKATDKKITGRSYLDITTGEAVEYAYYGDTDTDTVELNYSEQSIAANGMTAYFCVWPFEISTDEEFTVSVITETKKFERTIAAPRDLTFSEGKATTFSVNFSGVAAQEVPVISLAWDGYTTEYKIGDKFLKDGTVMATYDNYEVKDVSSLATFSTPDMSSTGDKEVTVSFGGKSTTGTITVKDSSLPELTYTKVKTAPADWSGKYLIVCEEAKVIFNGSLTTLDAASNNVSVTIDAGTIKSKELSDKYFTITKDGDNFTIKSASGYYIGNESNGNALKSSTTTTYANSLSFDAKGNFTVSSAGSYLRYNATSGQDRFRYFKSSSYTSQKAIQLYKLVE